MPVIPQFQKSSQRRAGQGPSLAAATAVTRAVSELAGEVTGQAKFAIQQQKQADDAAYLTESTNAFLRGESELLADIETTGADVDMKAFSGEYQERVDSFADNAPSAEARNEFLSQADNALTRKFFPSYAKHQAGNNVKRRVSAVSNAIDDINSEVLTGRTSVPEAVARAESAIVGLDETAGGVVDIDAVRQSALSGIGVNAITAKINNGLGEQVIEEIQNGDWDRFTTTKELSALQRQAMKAVSEQQSKEQAAVDQQNALQASNLEINVFRNDATYKDIEDALDAGVITTSKRTQLYKQLDSNVEKAEVVADNLTRVQTSLSMGIPLDPTSKEDKEGVNQMWAAIAPTLNDQDGDGFANGSVSFIQSTGILPKQLKGNIAAFTRSGNPEQAAQAADIIGRMQDVNSPALNDLTKESYAFGLSVQSLVAGGVDQSKAVNIARESAFGQSAQDKKTASLVLKNASPDNVTFLNDKMDEFDPGIFSAQPELTPVLQAEFEVLLGEMVPFTNGNIDQARAMAWTSMKNVWGATTINGGTQMMKYAPEAIYGKGGNAEWIPEQFNTDITEAGGEPENSFITSDTNTARSENPSYPVFTRDDQGNVAPMLDENNLPLRWKPEFSSSPAYKELEAEQQKRINRAKFRRGVKEAGVIRRQKRLARESALQNEFFEATRAK